MFLLQAHGYDGNVFSKLHSLGLTYTENIIHKHSIMVLSLSGHWLFIHTSLCITKQLKILLDDYRHLIRPGSLLNVIITQGFKLSKSLILRLKKGIVSRSLLHRPLNKSDCNALLMCQRWCGHLYQSFHH